MHAVNLIALNVPDVPAFGQIGQGVCCVTGERTACIRKEDLIGESFMDWDLLAAPSSPHVGIDAYLAWSHGVIRPGKKVPFHLERHGCWFVSEWEWRQVTKVDVRKLVLEGAPDTPWAGWVTTGFRKHGSLRAPVNFKARGIWGFDELRPDCSEHGNALLWWNRLRYYQDAGLSRKTMSICTAPSYVLKRIDPSILLDFIAWRWDKFRSPLFAFLLYLLPSQKELENGL